MVEKRATANRLLVISDFNAQNLGSYLKNENNSGSIEVSVAPFGMHNQLLLNPNHAAWEFKPDVALIWTSAAANSPSFAAAMQGNPPSLKQLREEVETYATQLIQLQQRVKTLLVPTWVAPSWHPSFGLLDWKEEHGISRRIAAMNLWLAELVEKNSGIFLLDTPKWLAQTGSEAVDPKLWYLAKSPFSNQTLKAAAQDISWAVAGIFGRAKKVIVLDLDDTLWGGIIGDIGWEKLRLGGHDAVGEAFVDFQKNLKALTQRGIILAVVSKNTESVALEGIDKHPEMILRRKDFSGWRINWKDKASNVAELLQELNLGMQSAVFIDDNPVERARVREAFPEILVPEWPTDKLRYSKALSELCCFQTPSISEEDRSRTSMYVAEQERGSLKQAMTSMDDWLKSLEQRVTFEMVSPSNFERTLQLLNKTNQMNLQTRRLTESELKSWLKEPGHHMWTCRVLDKFGDSGITGIIGLSEEKNEAVVSDYVLSCRVMGRRVEESLIYVAATFASKQGLKKLTAKYLPTSKNKPCLDFFQKESKLEQTDDKNSYQWDLKTAYPKPASISIEVL